MSNKRKTFYLNDDKEKPITAGGVILYKIKNDKIYLLLINSKGNYKDFGGRSDDADESIFDVVSRQAHEESNYILDKDTIKDRLISAKSAYMPHSKYIIYVVFANDEESKLTSEIFDKRENSTSILRRIKWVPMEVFMKPAIIKHKVSMRLKNKDFFDILKYIEKDMLEWEIFS
jgi:hypothetical protein